MLCRGFHCRCNLRYTVRDITQRLIRMNKKSARLNKWRFTRKGSHALVILAMLAGALGLTATNLLHNRGVAGDVAGGGETFLSTFDGDPAAPQPFTSSATWDVTYHTRDRWARPGDIAGPIQAMHGSDCGAPPATHTISTYADGVFNCRNHIMTSLNDGGYGEIVLTPNRMVDFSQGEAIIKFDISTERFTDRDWIAVTVAPMDKHIQVPILDWIPDGFDFPREGVTFDMGPQGGGGLCPAVIHNFKPTSLFCNITWAGWGTFLTPSSTRRDTIEIHISKTHLKIGMPAYDKWFSDATIDPLLFDKGIVTFEHHSYNPKKGSRLAPCPPGTTAGVDCFAEPTTMHWDNISISPSLPFTMIHGDREFVGPGLPDTITLSTPAPAHSYLRFIGISGLSVPTGGMQVSFNGGTTWQKAALQDGDLEVKENDEFFDPYWMAIPSGTSTVKVRAENGWWGAWHARNFAVFSTDNLTPTSMCMQIKLDNDRPSQNQADVTLEVRSPQSGAVVASAVAQSDITGKITITDTTFLNRIDQFAKYDIWVKPKGYLARKTKGVSDLFAGCTDLNKDGIGHYKGDLNSDNKITLTDLIIGAKHFNGGTDEHDALVKALYPDGLRLADLLRQLKNYQTHPDGD